jgi:hypothetical protein
MGLALAGCGETGSPSGKDSAGGKAAASGTKDATSAKAKDVCMIVEGMH